MLSRVKASEVYPKNSFIFEVYIYILLIKKKTYNFTLTLSSLNFVRLFLLKNN